MLGHVDLSEEVLGALLFSARGPAQPDQEQIDTAAGFDPVLDGSWAA